MLPPLKLKSLLAENANANQDDVLAIKTLLRKLGLYEAPEWGMTEFPDRELFKAIRAFQDRAGLKVDGRMKPEGETEIALYKAARTLQGLGRNGDTVLAHISPAEARMLKAKGGAGTVNPRTGLLEFYVAGKDKDGGQYIWRTQGDRKVRSSHAERNGKTFSWDDPPEGGHPGEAPNCRCSAEDVKEKEKDKCKQLSQETKKAEADLRGAQSLHDGAQKAVNEKTDEVDQLYSVYIEALIAFAIENGIALRDISKGRIPRGVQIPSDVQRAKEAYVTARRESKILIDEVKRARELLEQALERVSELREQLEAAGCGT